MPQVSRRAILVGSGAGLLGTAPAAACPSSRSAQASAQSRESVFR